MRFRSTKRDTFGPNPRVTITDATGRHVEYNRRFPKQNSRCSLEVSANPDKKWASVQMTEYGESDGGNGRAKIISMSINEDEARKIYELLHEIYG